MKSIISKTAATLGVALLMSVFAAGETLAKVNVPFDFQVGNTKLEAGAYSIQNNFGGVYGVVVLLDSNGKARATVSTMPLQSNRLVEKQRIQFTKYGDRYFLSQIWTSGTGTGFELFKRSDEREVIAAGAEQPRTDVIHQGK